MPYSILCLKYALFTQLTRSFCSQIFPLHGFCVFRKSPLNISFHLSIRHYHRNYSTVICCRSFRQAILPLVRKDNPMDSLHLCNTTPLLKTFKLCLLTAVLFIFTITTGSAIAQAVRRPLHSSHIPAEVQQSRIVGHLDRSTRMNLSIGLPLRNQEELNALLTAISISI